MRYIDVDVPYKDMLWNTSPKIEVRGSRDEGKKLLVTYVPNAAILYGILAGGEAPGPIQFVEVCFEQVVEYRFVDERFAYTDFPQIIIPHLAEGPRGIVELEDSPYLEHMLSFDHPRRMSIVGPPLRHFIIMFDHYGRLNIIASNITVREYERNMTIEEVIQSPFCES